MHLGWLVWWICLCLSIEPTELSLSWNFGGPKIVTKCFVKTHFFTLSDRQASQYWYRGGLFCCTTMCQKIYLAVDMIFMPDYLVSLPTKLVRSILKMAPILHAPSTTNYKHLQKYVWDNSSFLLAFKPSLLNLQTYQPTLSLLSNKNKKWWHSNCPFLVRYGPNWASSTVCLFGFPQFVLYPEIKKLQRLRYMAWTLFMSRLIQDNETKLGKSKETHCRLLL